MPRRSLNSVSPSLNFLLGRTFDVMYWVLGGFSIVILWDCKCALQHSYGLQVLCVHVVRTAVFCEILGNSILMYMKLGHHTLFIGRMELGRWCFALGIFMHPDFNFSGGWVKCWELGLTPWDLGQATPIIVHLHQSGALPKGRALVPGCGTVSCRSVMPLCPS